MSHSPEIVRATREHIAPIATNMRLPDRREIWLASRLSPVKALQHGVESGGWTALIDGYPSIMFGVARPIVLGSVGIPWLLATPRMRLIPREFARTSAAELPRMSQGLAVLENYVHDDNSVSIRWLEWLGFEMDDAKPHGPFGAMFRRFYKYV